MYLLEVEPLDLGPDVRAVGIELVEGEEDRQPVRKRVAARIWSRVLAALSDNKPWTLDFFSHLDRLREYCARHNIPFRQAADRAVAVSPPPSEALEGLLERFETETFGARAGAQVETGDAALENELARRGVDAYHGAFPRYFFCAVCDFENGSLVLLSNQLWASEVIRRTKPALRDLAVEIRLAA